MLWERYPVYLFTLLRFKINYYFCTFRYDPHLLLSTFLKCRKCKPERLFVRSHTALKCWSRNLLQSAFVCSWWSGMHLSQAPAERNMVVTERRGLSLEGIDNFRGRGQVQPVHTAVSHSQGETLTPEELQRHFVTSTLQWDPGVPFHYFTIICVNDSCQSVLPEMPLSRTCDYVPFPGQRDCMQMRCSSGSETRGYPGSPRWACYDCKCPYKRGQERSLTERIGVVTLEGGIGVAEAGTLGQGMPADLQLGNQETDSSLNPQNDAAPLTCTLTPGDPDFGFWPSTWKRKDVCGFKSLVYVVCYSSPRKLTPSPLLTDYQRYSTLLLSNLNPLRLLHKKEWPKNLA